MGLDHHGIQEQKEKGDGKLVLRNEVIWDKVIVCMKHAAGKNFGDCFRSELKVSESFISAQSTKQLDNIDVNSGCEESQ